MHYDLNSIQGKVAKILRVNPLCRNSDTYLIAYYMRKYHNITNLFEWARSTKRLKVTAETIRRTRQKINADGYYLPTDPEVLKRRRLLQDTFRNYAINKHNNEEV